MSPISETGRLAGIEAIPTACPEPTYHYRTGSVCIVRISGETVLSAGANAAATAPKVTQAAACVIEGLSALLTGRNALRTEALRLMMRA
ncbi:hypothetical protein LZ190_04330 [Rhodovulum sulfidophilum]|nr:hypothetical protein [Rhodovulum sulfidophilum]